MSRPTAEQIAWGAGIFECEGFFTGGEKGRPPTSIQVTSPNGWVTARMAELFGGSALGPYGPYEGKQRPVYRWQLNGDAAVPFLELVLPLLSPDRRALSEAYLASRGGAQ